MRPSTQGTFRRKAKESAAAFAVSGTGTTMQEASSFWSSRAASRVPAWARDMYTLEPSISLATLEK